MPDETSASYEFGRFHVKAEERVLRRGDELVALTPKAFDILLTLLENAGRIVNKEDLMKKVWPKTFVEEGNLTQNVSMLRKALGESANGPQFIETVPRRGYRLLASQSASTGHAQPIWPRAWALANRTLLIVIGGLALLLLLAIAARNLR